MNTKIKVLVLILVLTIVMVFILGFKKKSKVGKDIYGTWNREKTWINGLHAVSVDQVIKTPKELKISNNKVCLFGYCCKNPQILKSESNERLKNALLYFEDKLHSNTKKYNNWTNINQYKQEIYNIENCYLSEKENPEIFFGHNKIYEEFYYFRNKDEEFILQDYWGMLIRYTRKK